MDRSSRWTVRLAKELGIQSLYHSPVDTKLLCLSRYIRLFAYGTSTLILALYLSSIGISDARIGGFMSLTLLGDVAISFFLTLVADQLGRRRILQLGAGLMFASGIVFTLSQNYWILVTASILGVISPSGNEIGPFRAIEESTLAQLTPKDERSDIFAWYTLFGTVGIASGTIICGWAVQHLKSLPGWTPGLAYRSMFIIYAVLGLLKLMIALLLSAECESEVLKQEPEPAELEEVEAEPFLGGNGDEETDHETSKPRPLPTKPKKSILPSISPSSRLVLFKLCLLFALDSGGSGLVPATFVTYFFTVTYHLEPSMLGTLFSVTNLISSFSNLAASSLSKRIGLVKTMVFTHLPSSFFLAMIPVPKSVIPSMIFLILRACTQSMDQAPRQAFLSAVVKPNERTAVMGVVNVVKTLAQSGGPGVTGWLAGKGRFWVAFVAGASLKASYDLGMLWMFLGHRETESVETG